MNRLDDPRLSSEPRSIPRDRMASEEVDPDLAYQIVHDELMLDGNARLNLATFVGTWAEPNVERLMGDSVYKNMIDTPTQTTCCSPPSRSPRLAPEAAMLADMWLANLPTLLIFTSGAVLLLITTRTARRERPRAPRHDRARRGRRAHRPTRATTDAGT